MTTCDHAALELAHIRAMIAALERLPYDDAVRPATRVTSPDLPPPLEREAHALLQRLDALRASRTCRARDRP
ncbi:hypothetical protein [Paraburkholderia pallida]|uniref:Uncharacterized protein n=1 Tax=Paraburkholderia pallida TaxID=2547399 RepID=A0A4V1B0U7_9BURK|nr:hypothetical protein [Paraburkholderia pallida]QBR04013.1 hypothetical protein E1956_43230 [Paraburkholderia pallida]